MMLEMMGRMALACLMAAAILPTLQTHLQTQTQDVMTRLTSELEDTFRQARTLETSARSPEPSRDVEVFNEVSSQESLPPLPTVSVSPTVYAQLVDSTSRTP